VTESLTAPGKFVPVGSSSGGLKLPEGSAGRIMIAAIVGMFVLFAMVFLLSARPDVIVHKRIAPYTESKRAAVSEDSEEPRISILHQLFTPTERIIGSMNFWQKMSARLEQADLPLRTAELFYIQMGSAMLLGFIMAFLLGHRGIWALGALIVGALLPAFYVKMKAKKRLSMFENQLPETLIPMPPSL